MPAPETLSGQTLTTFDWLDTRIEEVVARTDRQATGHASTMASLTSFPETRIGSPSMFSIGEESSRVLSKVLLGYSPVIDRYQGVIATRLSIVPTRPESPPDPDALLLALSEVWPEEGGAVALNVTSELLLANLLRARPNRNMMVEIPWFVAAEPTNVGIIEELAARGNTLLLKGRPGRELPREVLPCFKWSLIDIADDRRLTAPPSDLSVLRRIAHIQTGVRTMAQLRQSFEHGAIAVIGWPLQEPIGAGSEPRPDVEVVLELIEHIDRGQSAEVLNDTLMRDPLLAFELLRHLQGAAPGLRLETASFRHALSLLGDQALRRWLGSMLVRTGDDMRLRPLNFAALRRGLLMRHLATPSSNAQTRSELFMCGVFSLLDRAFARPIEETLSTLVLPERVRAALVDAGGPFFLLLELVRAIESELPSEIRAAADAAYIEPLEINRALLKTLFAAADLERVRAARPRAG
jgi:c-di-GMP phosphodiesterase